MNDSDARRNHLGQPVGFPVPGWTPRSAPPRTPMIGRFARVEPLDPDRHAAELFEANAEDREGRNWTYYNYGPFPTLADYRKWAEDSCTDKARIWHAIIDQASGNAVGVAAYANIQPAHGSIEVGGLNFSPRLQRRPAATDAMHLMMRRAFDELGYRRYEWKCDSLNAPSRRAAERFGFTYEGIFRQHMIVKGRSRDTAWFSILDSEWAARKAAFERWLTPENFDRDGRQKTKLGG
jgi:RimJ/RimL family protein N-acetyltransferase